MVLSAWLVFECKTVLAAFILIWLPIFCECGLQTAYVLHEMVQQGQHDSVESILKDKTAHIDTKNHYGFTALHLVEDEHMADLLIGAGADVNANDNTLEWTPLHYAAHYDKPNLAKALIRHQADLDKRTAGIYGSLKPLHMAARRGNANVARTLIDGGADAGETDKGA